MDLIGRLASICGRENVLSTPEDLIVFEYDAGFDRRPPSAVVVILAANLAADGLYALWDPRSRR